MTASATNLEAVIQNLISSGAIHDVALTRAGNDISIMSTVLGTPFSVTGALTSNLNLIGISVEDATPSSRIDITTAPLASSAMPAIDLAMKAVNDIRTTLGGYVNQLVYAGDNASGISSNAAQSRSTIIDADYALVTTHLAKNQIVQQAATSMLAQANQTAQAVMALLKNI